jgi:NADP-dependent 3-hydroxy acid dehydrogenase YdfG
MTTIAIVGAGRGLGAAVARRFGREGLAVALLSRNQARVDALASELTADGIQAAGFATDVRDPDSLARALERATETLGPIEVLQYSPLPQKDFMRPILETTPADLKGPVEFSIYGTVAAVHQVIPGMRAVQRTHEAATPTILFVNGGSATTPRSAVTGTSVAFAGQAAYAQILHDELADEGIHVAQLIIPGAIDPSTPDQSPDALADRLWGLHVGRDRFRLTVGEDD